MIDIPEPDLIPATAADAGTLDRLHQRLVDAATADGSLDVAYRTIDSPLGLLLLASTEQGLVRLAYEREDHDRVLQTLGTRVSPRILRAPGRLDETARQLDAYFAGSRRAFDVPVDLRLSTGSGERSWTTCGPSATATPSPTRWWLQRPDGRARSGRWARRVRPTRFRCRALPPGAALRWHARRIYRWLGG